MWESTGIKTLRWVFYIPLVWIIAVVLNYIIGHVSLWAYGLSNFWLIFLFLFGGGMVFQLGGMIFSSIIFFLVNFCPDKDIGGYIFSGIGGIITIYMLYSAWINDLPDGFRIIFTILIVLFWSMAIHVALNTAEIMKEE